MQDAIFSFISQFGYAAVSGLIFLENVFPPIPSELILPLAGFFSRTGALWLPLAILAATIGSLAGAYVLYAIGTALDEARLSRILSSKPARMLGFEETDVRAALGWFETKGQKTILICRCIPVVRSLISIPAGMSRMGLGRFSLRPSWDRSPGTRCSAVWVLGRWRLAAGRLGCRERDRHHDLRRHHRIWRGRARVVLPQDPSPHQGPGGDSAGFRGRALGLGKRRAAPWKGPPRSPAIAMRDTKILGSKILPEYLVYCRKWSSRESIPVSVGVSRLIHCLNWLRAATSFWKARNFLTPPRRDAVPACIDSRSACMEVSFVAEQCTGA